MESKENTLENKDIVSEILQRLQELHGVWWKRAKQWKEFSETKPSEKCLSSPQETAMIANFNCANEIKAILDEFLLPASDIHKES